MLIKGNLGGNKTELLAEYYSDLIKKGVKPDNILVVLLNPVKKADFIKQIGSVTNKTINIFTFAGLCYNAFLDNWGYISKFASNDEKPNLCGLEVSQFIFKKSIKAADFSDYISKVNLLHQLFRRYSLIVQNGLSNKEVEERSKISGESFYQEAQKAIDDYKVKTFKYKSFDYLRQLAVFPQIYNNTDYFGNIKYLIVDDADEFSFAFWKFVDTLMPQLKDYLIAYDDLGSSRCGYLCAYKSGIDDFIQKYSPKIKVLDCKSTFSDLSSKLFNSIKNSEKIKISQLSYYSSVKRLDMLDEVNKQIKDIAKKGVKLHEIAVITPIIDEVIFESFNNNKIKYQILSGSEKLFDDTAIRFIIIILKLINNIKISEFELKNIMINLLKIPFSNCYDIIVEYKKENNFINCDLGNEKFNYKYTKFISFLNAQKILITSIGEQIRMIKENLLKEFSVEFSSLKYNFLLKEAASFETAFKGEIENVAKEFIIQTENSIISENPADTTEIKEGKVVISSPQKIIDIAYKTKYQIWIDVSSNEWIKNDTGTLYNAWVLSRDWDKETFTLEDNIALTNDKLARVVRKLMLCAEDKIFLYSSLYDNFGNENFGGINEYISFEQKSKPEFKIIPRKDQESVLEYKGGKLGVMAVPGAGKTTILLALIIKLMQNGVKGENIFVLTYMEAAAKNFKERIKAAMPEFSQLPNISTIHGLALRIIKENGNYSKVGLDDNFQICDDNLKENIIRGLLFKFNIDEDKYDNYIKGISYLKLSCLKENLYSQFKEIQDVYKFYGLYNKYLKQNNLIDYDDMLYLAIKLLENDTSIREYYQNLCQYVIEDEAQDSSDIQQKLISLLNGKYNNLVRCGDINQAITSTFTNSNPESFKNFINENNKIEMVSSQRCSKGVYTLANKFIAEAQETDAFYYIQMQETENNPKTNEKPQYKVFETEQEEKDFIINKIKEIKTENPSTSVAILLRLNAQVNEYNELFLSNDIKTIIRTDYLNQKIIYKIIYSLLKILQNPTNNNNIADFAVICGQKNIYKFQQEDIDYIKSLKKPFIFQNVEDITSEQLLQFYFDLDYHINNSAISTDILALNIGLYYSENNTDKSNTYMIASLIKKLELQSENDEELMSKLDYVAQRNTGLYKFFEDNENDDKAVKIMTLHKSKGDEFDYVFIPQFNEANYPTSEENAKVKTETHFLQAIKAQSENTQIKTKEELKKEQIKENLRLIYVGITRAKQTIYFTHAYNYKRRKSSNPIEMLLKLM